MQTYPLNSLAEQFETDRSTMVRAMRNVPPDLVKRGNRPTWKTATAARALEAHRAKTGGGDNGGGATLSTERAALAREQTAAVQLKNAVARGDLVSLTLVGKRIETMLAVFRERVLSIPGKMADPLSMRTREEIEPLLRAELYEALAELSNPAASKTADA